MEVITDTGNPAKPAILISVPKLITDRIDASDSTISEQQLLFNTILLQGK